MELKLKIETENLNWELKLKKKKFNWKSKSKIEIVNWNWELTPSRVWLVVRKNWANHKNHAPWVRAVVVDFVVQWNLNLARVKLSSARVLCWHDRVHRVPFLSAKVGKTRPPGIDERSSVSPHHAASSLRGSIMGEGILVGLDTSEVPVYVDRTKRKQHLSGSWFVDRDRAKGKQYLSGLWLNVANVQFRVIFDHILKS